MGIVLGLVLGELWELVIQLIASQTTASLDFDQSPERAGRRYDRPALLDTEALMGLEQAANVTVIGNYATESIEPAPSLF
jgi:hypothetical protein